MIRFKKVTHIFSIALIAVLFGACGVENNNIDSSSKKSYVQDDEDDEDKEDYLTHESGPAEMVERIGYKNPYKPEEYYWNRKGLSLTKEEYEDALEVIGEESMIGFNREEFDFVMQHYGKDEQNEASEKPDSSEKSDGIESDKEN